MRKYSSSFWSFQYLKVAHDIDEWLEFWHIFNVSLSFYLSTWTNLAPNIQVRTILICQLLCLPKKILGEPIDSKEFIIKNMTLLFINYILYINKVLMKFIINVHRYKICATLLQPVVKHLSKTPVSSQKKNILRERTSVYCISCTQFKMLALWVICRLSIRYRWKVVGVFGLL